MLLEDKYIKQGEKKKKKGLKLKDQNWSSASLGKKKKKKKKEQVNYWNGLQLEKGSKLF